MGEHIISASKYGSKVTLWGPAETLRNALGLLGLSLGSYHTIFVLRTMEEFDLFVVSPAILTDLLSIEFRWMLH